MSALVPSVPPTAAAANDPTAAAAAAATAVASASSHHPPSADQPCDDLPRQTQDDHDAPDKPARTSNSGSSSSATTHDPTRQFPIARLYRHALESIFAFLNQSDLATALQASHDWLAAAQSMTSLQLTLKLPSSPMCAIAESAVGRHVTQIGTGASFVTLTADALFIVAHHMAHLRVLFADMKLSRAQGRLAFPPALQKLQLHITGDPAAANVNAALQAVSRLPLLTSFALYLPAIDDQMSLSFAPLASMAQLRVLRVRRPTFGSQWSDAQVAQLRALPLLRQLDVRPMTPSLLRRLLASSHALQWQQLTLPDPTDDEAAALLAQLPSLTRIDTFISGSRLEWLQRLPNLTEVKIEVAELDDGGSVEPLVAALQGCPKIERLSLSGPSLRAAHLTELLPRLPRLQTLTLESCNFESLSFLAQEPMMQQLSELTLLLCKELSVAELRHVHALKCLQSLSIVDSFTAPLDDDSQRLLTPPSAVLPQLQTFFYTAE